MTEYLVINSNDSGIGSLRFGINSGLYTDIILIDGLTEINLSSTIYIHSNITLTMNAPSPIYIQCNSDTIFTLADSDITLTMNGNILLHNSTSTKEGGAINNKYPTNKINLSGITIKNCSALYGGGIFTFGPLILNNCIINNNTAYYVGGGVFSCNSLQIDNCTFSQNIIITETEYIGGAGLFVFADTNSTGLSFNISDTEISNNFVKFNPLYNTGASGAGIMILIFDYTINFNRCIIENNLSKNGSGIMVVNGNVSCTNTIIQNNASTNYAEQQDPNI